MRKCHDSKKERKKKVEITGLFEQKVAFQLKIIKIIVLATSFARP